MVIGWRCWCYLCGYRCWGMSPIHWYLLWFWCYYGFCVIFDITMVSVTVDGSSRSRDGLEDLDSQGDGSSQPDTISIASRTSQNTVDSDKVGRGLLFSRCVMHHGKAAVPTHCLCSLTFIELIQSESLTGYKQTNIFCITFCRYLVENCACLILFLDLFWFGSSFIWLSWLNARP